HLAQNLVVVGGVQDLSQAGSASLEAILELSAGATGGSRLFQCRCPLLLGQLGQGHHVLRDVGFLLIGAATVPTPSHRFPRGSGICEWVSAALRLLALGRLVHGTHEHGTGASTTN